MREFSVLIINAIIFLMHELGFETEEPDKAEFHGNAKAIGRLIQSTDGGTDSDEVKSQEKDKKYFIRSSHTVRGDERVNGCYDLARLDAKELLLSELANEVRGRIDNAQQSISENAEAILGKVRSGEFEGRITGLRFTEQYFERYLVGGMERIDCHVLGAINENDYNQVKRNVVHKIADVDPRLKQAITRGQIDFFTKKDRASDTATEMASQGAPKQN